jgi:hypothetical protein
MKTLACLVFVLALASCARSPEPEATARCPAQEFSEFLEAFSESQEVQRAFTKYPLEKQQVDVNATPEPKPFTRRLERQQVEFPLIPNKAERKAQSLDLRVDPLAAGQVRLTLLQSDTDYQVSYFFRKDACWELERIEDASL